MEMTRNQLLNGLYAAKDLISKIIQLKQEQVNIVAQYRQEQKMIETNGVQNQSKLLIAILATMIALFYLFLSLITGDISTFLVFAVCGAIVYWKRNQRSKLKIAASVILVLCVFSCLYTMIQQVLKGNIFVLILMIVFCAAAVGLILSALKFINNKTAQYNKQVEEHNQNIQNTFNNLVKRTNELTTQLQNQTGSWFPKKYYCIYAIDFFIEAVENYRADNVKEMVNLFENSEHQRRMEEGQDAINAKLDQSLINQQEINKSLKFANVLNTIQIGLQYQTLGAINRNTSAINANTSAVHRNTSAVNRNTDAVKSGNNTLDKIYSIVKKL